MDTEATFDFIGGAAALDFVNTEIVQQGEYVDLLAGFEHLAAWLVEAGLVDKGEMGARLRAWQGSAEREQALAEAKLLRKLLRDALGQIVEEERVGAEQLEELNEQFQRHTGHLQLALNGEGLHSRFTSAVDTPVSLLAPVVEGMADLLSHTDFSLIKRCGNPTCIRYFYDSTRNHSRRWCSMESCGNRMKVAAYYKRQRNR